MWQEWDDFVRSPRGNELKPGMLVAVSHEDGLHRYGEVVNQHGAPWKRKYEVLEAENGGVRTYT